MILFSNASNNFQVLGSTMLSKLFYIVRGTKTGDPLSAIIFIIVIDCIFKPAVNVALIHQNIQNKMLLNPLPVKGYAHDIARATHNLTTQEMINDQNQSCAVFYDKRSGNNWYKGKHDQKKKITIQNEQITLSKHNEPYKYLGKSISINGEDPCQVKEIISTYKNVVEKMCMSTPINL